MAIKFGFELEAFVLKNEKPVLVPCGLPYDECGWLVEIRSEPHHSVREAIHLLLACKERVERTAEKLGVSLSYTPLLEIPRNLKVSAARLHGKGLLRYQNLYGFQTHKNPTKLQTASLHISVTNQREFHHFNKAKEKQDVFCYSGFVDHAKLIVQLDRAFKAEISAAKRNPGFYEIKQDGRIEYRSLPNNVDLEKVISELEAWL
jgi:hypothetical protein